MIPTYPSVRARLAARQIVAPGRKWEPDPTPLTDRLPKFRPVPVCMGSKRRFPVLLSPPRLSDGTGTSKVLTVVKTFGRGPMQISNLRLGDEILVSGRLERRTKVQVATANFGTFFYECIEGRGGDDGLSLYPGIIGKDDFDISVPKSTTVATAFFTVKSTKTSSTQADVRFRFPNGLSKRVVVSGKATYTPYTLQLDVYWKPSSGSTWSGPVRRQIPGAANADAFEYSIGSILLGSPGTWHIGVRYSATSIAGEVPSVRWISLLSRGEKDMGGADGHGVIAIQGDLAALGNDQFLEALNADAAAELKETVSGSVAATRNPSAGFLDILQGDGNPAPVANSRIVSADIASWASANSAAGYNFDFTFGEDGGRGTIDDALRLACAAGRARYIIRDGRYTVLREPTTGTGSWLYTPANMGPGLRAVRESFGDGLHGIRCTVENRANLYRKETFVVYASGYSASNAMIFEDWAFDGVTAKQQAADLAAYHLAVLTTREKTYEFPVDFGHLRLMRGDLCRVAHPRLRRGTSWGEVTRVLSTTEVEVSRPCEMATGGTYALHLMHSSGALDLLTAVTAPGMQTRIRTTAAHGAAVGDHFAFGPSSPGATLLCVVLKVAHGANLSAVLTVAAMNLSPDPGDATGVAVTAAIPEPPPLRLPTFTSVSTAGGITLCTGGER